MESGEETPCTNVRLLKKSKEIIGKDREIFRVPVITDT
jgi:hypothetical protein